MDIWDVVKSGTAWTALGAIATTLGAGAIVVAARQLRFQAYLKAQEIWTDVEFTAARGRVLARFDDGRLDWTDGEEVEALNVCRRMDEFARLIPYLPRKTALQVWGVPFARAWFVLRPVVDRERTKCAWPEKWCAFEELGRLALNSPRSVRQPVAQEARMMGNMSENEGASHKFAEARGIVEHEDELINHRFSWLIGAQSILLAAWASSPSALGRQLLPWAGLLSALFTYSSILAAIWALECLRTHEKANDLQASDRYPQLTSPWKRHWLGLAGPICVPPCFIVIWIVALLN
jgi:hypothetical protein